MKKTLAILLALALVFSSLSFTFAEETLPVDAQAAKDLGMLVGDQGGVTVNYLNTTPTRIQAAIMVLRLKGLEDDAKAFTGTDNFADADKAAWAKPIMAYLKANPQVGFGGVGNNTFNPAGNMDAKSYYKVMLETLGYKQTTTEVAGDFTWENLLTFAAEKNLKTVANVTSFKVADVATATIETLKANVKGGTKTLSDSLVEAKVITAEQAAKAGLVSALAVDSVVANTAKSFQVKFNKAVADTSKVTFAVTRGTVAVTATTTWNADKTVATLAAAAKLPEAAYTVVVKNDNTEMVKKDVTIGKEVVKNIEYVADKILRTNNHQGIVNFKVYNQYGEDVTNLALGRSISFITSTSVSTPTVDYKAGTILVQHGLVNDVYQLKDMKTVTITGRDTSTGFVQTNILSVSDTVGVVADVKLLGIVDENGNKVDFKFDTAKTYYLDYEATDVLGNKITNYDALTATLYGQDVLKVQSSNTSLVTITREKHPKDNTKLAFRLQCVLPAPSYDTPMTFLAIAPYAGKNSNLTVTLLRKAAVETFKMQNPAETASLNKAIEIPFEAFDQLGNAVTKYDDLVSKVQFSTSEVSLVRQGDGTAKLFGTFTAKQTYYITSTVSGSLTGSFSQISIDVKEVAAPKTIEALRHTMGYMNGSVWYENNLRINSFTIRDQFDNKMNLRADANGNRYELRISTSAQSVVAVRPAGGVWANTVTISGDTKVEFGGGITVGTATITYELWDRDANGDGTQGDFAKIDDSSTIAYNFGKSDIKSISYTASADPIYMITGDSVAVNLTHDDNLYNDTTLVGKTDSGMDVLLPESDVWFTSSNNKFVFDGAYDTTALDSQNGNQGDVFFTGLLATNEHSATTTVTAYYEGSNGVLTSSATITGSDAAPAAKSITISYSSSARRNGFVSLNNDVVTVSAAWLNNTDGDGVANTIIGKDLFYYGTDGNVIAPAAFSAYADSQYGALPVDNVIITHTNTGVGSTAVLSQSGTYATVAMAGAAASGDQWTFTFLTNNGQSKVVTLRVR